MAVQPDDARPLADLNDFRRDLLNVLDAMDSPHGLAIKETLEDAYDVNTIHHGRIYPALDQLEQKGLIDKQQADGRTNEYAITKRGRRELEAHRNWYRATDGDSE